MSLKKIVKTINISKNGLGLSIPKVFTEILKIEKGDFLEIECCFKDGEEKLIITKKEKK